MTDTHRPVANARMYAAAPAAKRAWNELLARVLERAGLAWDVIDYDPPAPLSALWARHDLGAAMMCGLPFSQRRPRPVLVAVPLPSPPRYGGRPVYFTDIVVRADSPARTLEDTFGGTVGYTVEDSMSGWAALRMHLLPFRSGDRPLYKNVVGNLVNGRRVIEALIDGRIDVGPLDSYYHDLLAMHDPAFAQRVRTVATTGSAPIPPLISTARLSAGELERFRAALFSEGPQPALLLDGFAVPREEDYAVFDSIRAAAAKHAAVW
jgi:ABC-type phosphate/phosphonate transport system substrate-binding protein